MDDLTIINTPKKILYIGFNYNSSYFMLGTDLGFQVHQTFPLALKFSRQLNGGIGLVQMLNKSNIFCLAGGGVSPKYAPNTLYIWDDKKRKEVHQFRFNYNVLNCYIKEKYLFAVCTDIICVISIETLKKLEIISTIENPNGISSISNDREKYIFAWPDLDKGRIALKDFSELRNLSVAFSARSSSIFSNKISFKAHENNIYYIKLSNDGARLATTSERGTIIRLFDTQKGILIKELRKGSGEAKIYSIAFSFDNSFLGITNDQGKVKIFLIGNENNKEKIDNIEKDDLEKKDEKEINDNLEKNDGKEINDNLEKNDDKEKNDVIKNKHIKENNDNIEKNDGDIEKNENKENNINNTEKENNNEPNFNNGDFVNIESSQIIDNKYEKNKNSILSGVSRIIGFNSLNFFAQFKLSSKTQSSISFIDDIYNQNVVVIDKSGYYICAEIKNEQDVRIIKEDLLI